MDSLVWAEDSEILYLTTETVAEDNCLGLEIKGGILTYYYCPI
jgi:hypothetical protein